MLRRRYTLACLLHCLLAATFPQHLQGRISQHTTTGDVVKQLASIACEKSGQFAAKPTACSFRISGDVGKQKPALLLHAGTLQLVRSQPATNGTLQLAPNTAILVACPGRGNQLKGIAGAQSAAVVRCAGDRNVSTVSTCETLPLLRLECTKWPEHQSLPNGTCLWGGHQRLQTGYQVAGGFVPLYETCFDARAGRTVYTRFLMASDAKHAQHGVQRSAWRGREHFASNPDKVYQKAYQRETFARLLGSAELAARYVHAKDDVFLSKGHLVAKTDFLQGAAQTATFRYTNAAPQWQTFNGNNWNALENDVRAFVERFGRDVWCYTGTYGVATLPDVNGTAVELYLGADRTIAVPRMYWKAVYDEPTQRGVVFVGLNNPHQSEEEARRDVWCRDVCGQLLGGGRWRLSWKAADVHRGWSYCCEVNDFRANFGDVLPEFAVVGVLK